MMEQTFNWKPEQPLLEKLIALASQQGQSPEAIVTEAVKQYLLTSTVKRTTNSDPLVGLFASSPDLELSQKTFYNRKLPMNQGEHGEIFEILP